MAIQLGTAHKNTTQNTPKGQLNNNSISSIAIINDRKG